MTRQSIFNRGKWLGNLAKFAILGVDPAQNLTKYKRWLCVLIQPTNGTLRLRYSCIVYEHETKDVQGQGPSNIDLSLFICFFDVYRPS